MGQERKWTEGPWEVLGDDEIDGVPVIEITSGTLPSDQFKPVADVRPTMDEDDDFILTEEDRANARLISTAPELFEALDALLPVAQAFEKQASQGAGGRRGGQVFARARAALAKATGESQ